MASKWFIKKGCQKHPFPAWPSASNPQFPFKPCRIPPFLSYHLFLVGRNGDPFFSGTRAPPRVSGNRKRKRSLFAWAPRTNKALTQVGTPHPPQQHHPSQTPMGERAHGQQSVWQVHQQLGPRQASQPSKIFLSSNRAVGTLQVCLQQPGTKKHHAQTKKEQSAPILPAGNFAFQFFQPCLFPSTT